MITKEHYQVIIIGAGMTGLSAAFRMKQLGVDFLVLEKDIRTGGLVNSVEKDGFTLETGPNTGVVKYPEVAELFEALGNSCTMQQGRKESKRRLIWKGDRFRALPSGLFAAVTTPLFTFRDKIRFLGEPWRRKGTDPNESIAAMTRRRLGKSFLDYAVDPFLSGVYAANPDTLPTRWALPKLYALEQNYGSFIRGAIQKAKEPKTDRDRKATKNIFSAEGGLRRLVEAMTSAIGAEHIVCGAEHLTVSPNEKGYTLTFGEGGNTVTLTADRVVTTTPGYTLGELLPFVPSQFMMPITSLVYAPVVQIGVGVADTHGCDVPAFGGLCPSCEHRDVLGVLFLSSCFDGRAPKGGATYSIFIGGVRRPELVQLSDEALRQMTDDVLHDMLGYPQEVHADVVEIFRHEKAIPQYEANTGQRLEAIEEIEKKYPHLYLKGNIRDGIGMGDRIKQGYDIAQLIAEELALGNH